MLSKENLLVNYTHVLTANHFDPTTVLFCNDQCVTALHAFIHLEPSQGPNEVDNIPRIAQKHTLSRGRARISLQNPNYNTNLYLNKRKRYCTNITLQVYVACTAMALDA